MDISCVLSTTGGLLSLNDTPYRLAAGTFEAVQVTHRKAQVTNPFLEGSYTVNSLREDVVVPLNVWIEAATHADLDEAKEALTDALDQVNFTAYVTIEGVEKQWWCSAADYTVTQSRELLHSVRCRVDAMLPRHPSTGG